MGSKGEGSGKVYMGLYERGDESILTTIETLSVALTGLPTDQALFLLSQIVSIPLAFVLQCVLTAPRVGENVRHLYCLTFGILFNIMCFRWQLINVLIPAFAVNIILRVYGRSASLGKGVLAGSMLYLSANHIWRQYSDYGSYKLDITGPLMIFTQKITLLAYAYEDGQKPESENGNKEHKKHRIEKLPSLLAYCSYLLGFMGFQTGPCYFFDDYLLWVQGRNLVPYHKSKKDESMESLSSASAEVKYPSPNYQFVVNIVACALCGIVVDRVFPLCQMPMMIETHFIQNTSFLYKVFFMYLAGVLYRFRYYFAWKLGESICYAGGFGFTGWTDDGKEQWDLIKNCAIVKLETATSAKSVFDEWNRQTAKWLRFICYSRMENKAVATNAVFALSAAWHGFYPGYYVTFGQGMLMVPLGRKLRKVLRPRFQSTAWSRLVYEIMTFLGTHASLSFGVAAQILLRLSLVYKLYRSMYFYMLIIQVILLYLPIPKPREPSNTSHTGAPTNKTSSAAERVVESNKDASSHNDTAHHQPGEESSLRKRVTEQAEEIVEAT